MTLPRDAEGYSSCERSRLPIILLRGVGKSEIVMLII